MIKYNRNIPLLSIHIPKTGGSSFRYLLSQWFSDKLFTHYPAKEIIPQRAKIKTLFGRFKKDICIHGHFNRKRKFGIEDHYPDVNQLLCFFRNPLDVQLSTFVFKHRKLKDGLMFWDWPMEKIPYDINSFLYEFPSNMLLHMPKEINLSNYKEVINEKFIHLGLTETYSSSIRFISKKIMKAYIPPPIKNASNYRISPDKKAVDHFKSKHELEYKIFELACDLNGYRR